MALISSIVIPDSWIWGACALYGVLFIVRIYYIWYYRHTCYKVTPEKDHATPGITVLVYGCNDARNIREFLPRVLEQDYPEFDVVVVNDGSTDETNMELKFLEARYSNLYHTYLPEEAKTMCRRKLSTIMGFKAARREWVVMTTANSRPDSNRWLRVMADEMTPQTDIVLGYSGIEARNGGGNWLRFQNFFYQLRYLSRGIRGNAYMGIGNNLALRHDVLGRDIFSGTLNLDAGEDDIPVNRLSTPQNTRVALSSDSVVRVVFDSLSKGWRERLTKYSVTRRFYKRRGYRFWLGEPLSHTMMWVLWKIALVVGIAFGEWRPFVVMSVTGLVGAGLFSLSLHPLVRQFEGSFPSWVWLAREFPFMMTNFWHRFK